MALPVEECARNPAIRLDAAGVSCNGGCMRHYEYLRGLDPKTAVFLLRFVREEYPEMSTHDAISFIIMQLTEAVRKMRD